jgi:hypothetical protein
MHACQPKFVKHSSLVLYLVLESYLPADSQDGSVAYDYALVLFYYRNVNHL